VIGTDHRVDAAGLADVARALVEVPAAGVDDPAWVAAARRLWEEGPASIRREVRDFRRNSGPEGTLLITGLPLGEVPDTPSESGSVQRAPAPPAALLMLLAHGLGDPAAFAAEKSGALVQDVVPVPGQEEMQGNSGSVELTFHTENAFHAHRPDYVMLLCLRADHEERAQLRTSSIRRALPGLGAATRAALFEPNFVTQAPASFGTGGRGLPHAVLSGDPADPDICFDEISTTASTATGRGALAELANALRQHHIGMPLRSGQLAVVDNRIAVHGRSEFVPRYDGRDRWLQRTFAFTDLRRSRELRAGDGTVLR